MNHFNHYIFGKFPLYILSRLVLEADDQVLRWHHNILFHGLGHGQIHIFFVVYRNSAFCQQKKMSEHK